MYLDNILLVKTILLVVLNNIKCVHGGSLGSTVVKDNLQQNLAVNENIVKSLAVDICLDLKYDLNIYNKTVPFSEMSCQNNFIKSTKNMDKIPPKAQGRLKYQSNVVYSIAPIDDPDVRRLIVLTPINASPIDYLPYDLLGNNVEEISTIDITTGEFQSWTTLLSIDGNHSPWLRGDRTDEIKYTYEIQVKTEHQVVNGSSAIKAFVSWESFDPEDCSFDFKTFCGDKNTHILIWSNDSRSLEVSGLPMGADCDLQLTGKYGTTQYSYRTPDCGDLRACINYEKAQNLSLTAEPGSHGWNVFVSWSYLHQPVFFNVTFISDHARKSIRLPGNLTEVVFENMEDSGFYKVAVDAVLENRTVRTSSKAQFPDYEELQNLSLTAEPASHGWNVFVSWSCLHQPLFFNVTFISDHVRKSVRLAGNVTEVVFENVDDSGFYKVDVDAVLEARTVRTSSKAQFPEVAGWRSLSQALGGAWGALVCAGAAGAAAALLWRRRRRNQLKHIYFPDLLDKLRKESGDAADAETAASGDAWELRSERLLLHEVIGEGAFGVVRRGTMEPAGKEVAVKMLKDFPTLDEIRSFRAEIELMKSVGAHPHVVSLVGCCSGRKPFIVAEYCSRGDLLSYLRCSWDVMVSKRNAKYYNNNIESNDYRNDIFKCQLQGEHSKLVVNKLYDLQGICDPELTTRDLLSFCRQIAMGMEFLASNRLVHRDLAARNVLVSSDRTLKIADFGLSRDVYEENLYKQKGNGKMPMKWMALESLTRRIYTSQSDVWSFGVVMWEVVSVGASPYAGVAAARLPRLLRAGYRMPRPHNCSKHLYEVMMSCWRAHPRERPTFAQLHAHLDELLQRACEHHYLSLQPDGDDAPPRLSPHRYVKMYLKEKLGWSREESYERPLRTAQSNHYSTPPASTYKLQPVA